MTLAPPQTASLFHAGNTCPYCQESIEAGQLVVTCSACGSIHHETCWLHKNGCSSYHCDRSTSMPDLHRQADIVLSADEVASAVPMPARPRRSGQEVAAMHLPPKPIRHSRMAMIAAGLTALSLIGFLGSARGDLYSLSVGIVFALTGMAAGVVALVRINNPENRISGVPVAAGATVVPVVLVFLFFVTLNSQMRSSFRSQRVELNLKESLPKETDLDRMPAPTQNAMRASVVVRHGSGLTGIAIGSGVILRVNNTTATILTNRHVIEGAESGQVRILFYTGEESNAEIIWEAAEGVDLAVLQCPIIALDRYVAPRIAKETVLAGEKVFAIGNPVGLTWTYTEGSISSIREISGGPNGVVLYQTQTPINSGNSGGGLYALNGDLIGINTMTEDKQTSEGLSFAISLTTFLGLLTEKQMEQWIGDRAPKDPPPGAAGQ